MAGAPALQLRARDGTASAASSGATRPPAGGRRRARFPRRRSARLPYGAAPDRRGVCTHGARRSRRRPDRNRVAGSARGSSRGTVRPARSCPFVDGHRRMETGAPKRGAYLGASKVAAHAGIGDDRLVVERHVDRQGVRMPVRREREVPVRTVVEERSASASAQDAQAAVLQGQTARCRRAGPSGRSNLAAPSAPKSQRDIRSSPPAARAAPSWPRRAAIAAATPRPSAAGQRREPALGRRQRRRMPARARRR